MKTSAKTLFALAPLALLVASCGAIQGLSSSEILEAWKYYDAPIHLDPDFNKVFAELPTSAQLTKIPWTDSYWPSYESGIASRWNALDPENFSYLSPALSELQMMSAGEIATLSPAEKFDIFNGRYDYPLVQSEWSRTSPDDETWEGLCHGWAPASALFDEPKPVVMTNADGISIPFGSADVKALLSYYQGQIGRPPTQFLGMRCNVKLEDLSSDRAKYDDCKGVNPGAFHVVLANQIGLKNESFMADVTRDFEVWNHPISAFSSQITPREGVSPTAAPGTVQEYDVTTRMAYSVEIAPQWDSMVGRESSFTSVRVYSYTLEVDAAGIIVGGEWKSEDRPDFLWNQQAPEFTGYFELLETLYQASIQ